MTSPTLKRTLTLPHMVLYGLGTTIGAGIYALIGEIAGIAGYLAPAAFLLAALLASLTALSFAELSGRFPKAAGAALYTQQGFSSPKLAVVIGLMVCLAGIVSSAALINGFIGYLREYIDTDRWMLIVGITLVITSIAIWGIAESVTMAAIITCIEIAGLLTIVWVSRNALSELPIRLPELIPSADKASWLAISGGAILAFYAFIGFEDMVEVAEEVKDVKRTLPIAILMTIVITTFLYMAIMLAAVLALGPEQLAGSEAPLALLYETQTGNKANMINIIGMIAIINGAIIQIIMSSRILYGLSSRGQLPEILGKIHPRTQTPVIATALVASIILVLALLGRLAVLAEMTSLIVLMTFSVVNLSLWRIKQHSPRMEGVICVPAFLPLTGFLVCIGFVTLKLAEWVV
jgi:basic amino acid/polyamine antiporter, APA family